MRNRQARVRISRDISRLLRNSAGTCEEPEDAEVTPVPEDQGRVGSDRTTGALFTRRILTRSPSGQTEPVSKWLRSCPADRRSPREALRKSHFRHISGCWMSAD